MSTPPPPYWWEATRRFSGGGPEMRVSDAERSAIGDTLSRHYAEGRLDDNEFKERLDRAMSAKTRADLAGLTTDLPRLDMPMLATPPKPPKLARVVRSIPFLLTVLVISSLWWTVTTPHIPWVLVAVLLVLVFRHRRWHGHHHHRGPHNSPGGYGPAGYGPGGYGPGPGGYGPGGYGPVNHSDGRTYVP